jgi:magnesium-protoporphyrin O-methyltransferase
MDACGCDGFAEMFDRKRAERHRDDYHRNGPARTTRMLLELLQRQGVSGSSVLDVGGGIGVVTIELLRAGAGQATIVDASADNLAIARQEARERNLLARMEFVDGDYVEKAPEIDLADIVTLDRVICCYPRFESLVGLSAARARRAYGLVLPRDRWLVRIGIGLMNVAFRIRKMRFRAYAHSNRAIDQIVAREGLRPRQETGTFFWRVVVYDRAG